MLLILVEMLFVLSLTTASAVGAISLSWTGQVLMGIAVINFVLGLLAHFNWPVLRGDVSDLSPMNNQDSLETGLDSNLSNLSRPSRSFVNGLFVMGVIALTAGIVLLIIK